MLPFRSSQDDAPRRRHTLSRESVHHRWNRDQRPALIAESGDEIEFVTRAADDGQITPRQPQVDIDLERMHPLTGPVFIQGAVPGDALEVHILKVEVGTWGWQKVAPHRGFLKGLAREARVILVEIDRERRLIRYPSGAEVELAPFPGIVGVAPPQPGKHRTFPCTPYGGNLDVRELQAGCSLYLPVAVPGALLSVGDVHAAQGDGEVCLNGIETEGRVLTRVVLHKHRPLDRPHLKTPTHYGLLGVGETADAALRDALQAGILFLQKRAGLPPEEAYALCSGGVDLRINQLVNGMQGETVGARIMFPLGLLASLGVEPSP